MSVVAFPLPVALVVASRALSDMGMEPGIGEGRMDGVGVVRPALISSPGVGVLPGIPAADDNNPILDLTLSALPPPPQFDVPILDWSL